MITIEFLQALANVILALFFLQSVKTLLTVRDSDSDLAKAIGWITGG